MSNEIQRAIDDELPSDAPPVSLDVEAVMRASRRARQRRTGYQASGAVVSVVVAVAMVLTLTPVGGAFQETSPDGAAEQEKHSLDTDDPVVDPDKDYLWDGAYPAERTEVADAYTVAFWDHFTQEYPDATVLIDDAQATRQEHSDDFAERAFFMAKEDNLVEGDEMDLPTENGDSVRQRTILDMYERFEPGSGSNGTGCCGITVKYGPDDPVDGMDLQVFPKGSYTKRTEDIMDPAYCREGDTCDVKNVTGPDGEDLQYVTAGTPDDVDGTWHTYSRFVVHYREDGSAVRVEVSSSTDAGANVSDTLSHKDLRDIGFALPGEKVE